MAVTYKELPCKSALHRIKKQHPYPWDLNLYRGCAHGCKYCYALYAHAYLNSENYFDEIFVKTNILEHLERELAHPNWSREVVNIGGVTDSYQPAEEIYALMPEVLKLLIKYRTPAIISTKSTLILRDFDLIAELARLTYVNIALTITTQDEKLQILLEPNGASPLERFGVLKAFRETPVSTGVHLMPIIPYLTDDTENLEWICAQGRACGATYLLPGTLYLRGATRPFFFSFIQAEFPDLAPKFTALYQNSNARKQYKEQLYQRLNTLRRKYKITQSYRQVMQEKLRVE